MSNQCQITRGFFIQRVCGRDGTLACDQCGKLFCSKHRAKHVAGASLCVQCGGQRHARPDRSTSRWQRDEHDWRDDNTFTYHLRRQHSSRYHPLWYHDRHTTHSGSSFADDADFPPDPSPDLGPAMEEFPEDPNQPLEDFDFAPDDGDISAFDS